MNIAILTPQFIVGGAETYIIRKSQWLINHGHNVCVISAGGCMVDTIPSKIKHIEYDAFKYNPFSFPYRKFQEKLKKLSMILKENKINIIEAHNTTPILYAALSYRYHQIPYLFNDLLELSFDNSWQLRYLTKKISKKYLFFVLTEGMKTYVDKVCKEKLNTIVIPIPISSPENISSTHSDNYFLSVARISLDKMYVKELIVAFEDYLFNYDGEHKIKYLYIVGDGDEALKDELYQITIDINNRCGYNAIIMTGSLLGDELKQKYENCTAFIGLGTALLIAASYGKASIIVSGEKNMNKHAYGFWGCNLECDKKSIGASKDYLPYRISFFDALSKVSDTLFAEEVGEKAKALFKEVYDIDVIMNKWEQEYKRIISNIDKSFLISVSNQLYIINAILFMSYYVRKLIKKLL